MLDTSFYMQTGAGRTVTIERRQPVAIRKFGCMGQSFCPLCVPGNHSHVDGYGRPEYHCVSSRPWVGWQRVSFSRAGVVQCSCERGQVQAARGLQADCTAHSMYTLWMTESGQWPAPDELGVQYPIVISVSGGELFDDNEEESALSFTAPSLVAEGRKVTLESLFDYAA